MKKLTLIFTLLFSTVMFSSPSYAEWTKVTKDTKGNSVYVDFERIRKHDGYVYWWDLADYLKPITQGVLSTKRYNQGDCKLFRIKTLTFFAHTEPMVGGTGSQFTPPDKWSYPSPNSMNEAIIKRVCSW
jgi:hypothetical protein